MGKYQTEQRKKLIDFFKKSPHQSFSAQDISVYLKEDSISKSAIYRNLSEMVSDGFLCKVTEKHRSGTLYQYVDPIHCDGIIHFKCQNCENTFHLSHSISQMVIDLAREEFSFNVNRSSAFLYGECEKCSQKQTIFPN